MTRPESSTLETSSIRFRIGNHRVDPQRGTITRDERVVRLEPRVMDVLVCLANHPGAVVTRQQIVDQAWQGRFVDDLAVARCISKIRKALGDSSSRPQYILTFPKRGYSLAMVEGDVEVDRDVGKMPAPKLVLWLASAGVSLAIGAAILWFPGFSVDGSSRNRADGVGQRSSAVFSHPDQAWVSYHRGSRLGNENAIELFGAELQQQPDSPLAHAGLGSALALRSIVYGRGTENARVALQHSNRAIELDPTLAEAFKARGTALHSLGLFERAEVAYDQALALDPHHPRVLFNKAVLLRQQGRAADALDLLSMRVSIAGTETMTCAAIGSLLLELGLGEEADAWIELALEQTPLSVSANIAKARLDLLQEKLRPADRRIDRLLLADPLNGDLLRLSGEIALRQGDRDRARRVFQRSYELVHDGLEEIDRVRFASLLSRENPDTREHLSSAAQRLRAKLDRGVGLGVFRKALAMISALEGDHERAFEWLEEAVEKGHRAWHDDLTEPAFAGLASDRRFADLVESMQALLALERTRAVADGLPMIPTADNL